MNMCNTISRQVLCSVEPATVSDGPLKHCINVIFNCLTVGASFAVCSTGFLIYIASSNIHLPIMLFRGQICLHYVLLQFYMYYSHMQPYTCTTVHVYCKCFTFGDVVFFASLAVDKSPPNQVHRYMCIYKAVI